MKDEIQETNERAMVIVRENEKLIERAQAVVGAQDRILREAGLDPAQYRRWVAKTGDDKSHADARAEFEREMTELQHEVDAEAARLGIVKTAAPRRSGRSLV